MNYEAIKNFKEKFDTVDVSTNIFRLDGEDFDRFEANVFFEGMHVVHRSVTSEMDALKTVISTILSFCDINQYKLDMFNDHWKKTSETKE